MGVAWGYSVSSLVRGYLLVRGFIFKGSIVHKTLSDLAIITIMSFQSFINHNCDEV